MMTMIFTLTINC